MKINEVAQRVGISVQTVRNWGELYARYLSEAATPQPGQTRFYIDDDVRVLGAIRQLKSEGLSDDDLHIALASGELPELDFAEPEPQPEQSRALEVPVFRIMEDLRTENAELRGRNIDLERKLAKIEAQLVYHQKSLWDRVRGR